MNNLCSVWRFTTCCLIGGAIFGFRRPSFEFLGYPGILGLPLHWWRHRPGFGSLSQDPNLKLRGSLLTPQTIKWSKTQCMAWHPSLLFFRIGILGLPLRRRRHRIRFRIALAPAPLGGLLQEAEDRIHGVPCTKGKVEWLRAHSEGFSESVEYWMPFRFPGRELFWKPTSAKCISGSNPWSSTLVNIYRIWLYLNGRSGN